MTTTIDLKPGMRMSSRTCTTNVIVVRPGESPIDLRCGGIPMSGAGIPPQDDSVPTPPFDSGTLLGKRYTHPDDDSLEILATSGGAGALSDGDTLLIVKEAKSLPASD